VLGAAMQGPLAAVVLLLELTHHGDALMVPELLAVVEATVVARLLRAPSIYSARLSGESEPDAAPGMDAGPPELQAPGDLLPRTMR
jgi:H+/Cl- antiporter ClcA